MPPHSAKGCPSRSTSATAAAKSTRMGKNRAVRSKKQSNAKDTKVPAHRTVLIPGLAWFDHVQGNPLGLQGVGKAYPVAAAIADTYKEKYMLYGEKESKHYSRHYALDKKWMGKISQKLGSTEQKIHPPVDVRSGKHVEKAGWQMIHKFKSYLNKHYPATTSAASSAKEGGCVDSERNLAIIKHYANGSDCMGEHTDGKSLRNVPVASLSVGATRKIVIRAKKVSVSSASSSATATKKVKSKVRKQGSKAKMARTVYPGVALPMTVYLKHGDVFVMGGSQFQTKFTHELPAEKHVTEGRVGIVLRAREVV